MAEEHSYTLDEIEGETGFDKRTIAYYVQEGLLPRVGRRGPRTRYPQSYLDRLLLIKMIRERQDQGKLGSVTLSDIRAALSEMPAERISDIVTGKALLDTAPIGTGDRIEHARMAPPDHRIASLSRAPSASRQMVEPLSEGPMVIARGRNPRASAPPPDDETCDLALDVDPGPPQLELREVAESFQSVEYHRAEAPPTPPPSKHHLGKLLAKLARVAGRGRRGSRRSAEHWTRAAVTPDVALTARDLDEEHVELLERAAQLLRREILQRRSEDE